MSVNSPEYQRVYRAQFRVKHAHKNGLDWTTVERRTALEMRGRQKSYAQIGMKLGRTRDAVHAHLRAYRQATSRLREGGKG
jgi:hypothetical protein